MKKSRYNLRVKEKSSWRIWNSFKTQRRQEIFDKSNFNRFIYCSYLLFISTVHIFCSYLLFISTVHIYCSYLLFISTVFQISWTVLTSHIVSLIAFSLIFHDLCQIYPVMFSTTVLSVRFSRLCSTYSYIHVSDSTVIFSVSDCFFFSDSFRKKIGFNDEKSIAQNLFYTVHLNRCRVTV